MGIAAQTVTARCDGRVPRSRPHPARYRATRRPRRRHTRAAHARLDGRRAARPSRRSPRRSSAATATTRARLAADAPDVAADPAQVRSSGSALRRVRVPRREPRCWPAAATPFSAMLDRQAREALPARRGRRRASPQRRSAFQGLRKLLDVPRLRGPGRRRAPNPRLATIGYERPAEPVTADLDADRAARRFAPSTDGTSDGRADRPRCGRRRRRLRRRWRRRRGGPGRAPAARSSSSRPGRSSHEPTMPTDELDAFDRLYLDHGLNVDLGRLGHDPRRQRASAAGRSSTG